MKLKNLLFVMVAIFSGAISAQELFPPDEVIIGTFIGETAPLRDMPIFDPSLNRGTRTLSIVPNGNRTNAQNDMTGLPLAEDPMRQTEPGTIYSYGLEQNFNGVSQSESGFLPPDPTGAAGPNHYVHAVNSLVKIFDKTGNLVSGPTSLGNFLGIPSNSGDPIVLYDQLADRWFVSEFGSLGNSLAIGVSTTNDPTGTYNVYQFTFDSFPDYPHYSVWPDGYYLSANKGGTNKVYAVERDVLLAGGPSPQIVGFPLPGNVQNNNTVLSPEPANLLGTTFPPNTPGYIVYLQDDGWSSAITFDHLKIWEIDLDWVTIGNSTISAPLEVPTAPFNSVFAPFGSGDVNQPGTGNKIDMIGGIISYMANYRSFGTHNSFLVTFNTDIDGNDTSGVRWIELRNDAVNDWSIFQEGTYAPADGHSRFMGSAAMDAAGNIGLGFNIASATLPVGIRYTGRFDGDPLGTMTVAETTIVDGIGVQTTSNRFGDYSHLTMDPDNFTFWHTAEYFTSNNNWQSRIASFTLSSGFTNDVGVNNIIQPVSGILGATETVEVSIRNFGLASQTNIPLELRVDGNLIATETFTGTIASGDVSNYTFTATADLSTPGQTYNIEVRTNLGGDQFANNDSFDTDVTNIFANDVGTLAIVAPVTGSGLGDDETVSITIKNFGVTSQSNFDVQYDIDGGTPVVETFTGTIASDEEVTYDFTQTGDFSDLGIYTVTASTSLGTDQNSGNDEVTADIENALCQPQMVCSTGHGFRLFSIADINNTSGCEVYGDFRTQVGNLSQGTTYDLTVTTGWGNQHVTVWIDFNDDFIFTNDERVVVDYEIAPGQGQGTYTETFDLVIPPGAALGQHIMRAKTNFNSPVPTDACEATQFGETEDYTANIGVLGIGDNEIDASELIVTSLPDNQFEVTLVSDFEGIAYASVYNMLGQRLGVKTLNQDGNTFRLKLDMAQAASGVYILRVGGLNTTTYKTARIIVK